MFEFLKLFAIIVLLYFGYQLVLKHTGFLETSERSTPIYKAPNLLAENFEQPPMPAPVVPQLEVDTGAESVQPIPTEKVIAPAGPNAPAQKAPDGVRHVMAQEEPTDPYAEMQEDAYAPEKLRNPERMFRPAPENTNTSIAVQSGIASTANAVPQNVGAFAPEMAQNGGFFMDGVAANDLDMHVNFSEY
jgi:hypothetical protein